MRRAVIGTTLALSSCASMMFLACGGTVGADASGADASSESQAVVNGDPSVPPETGADPQVVDASADDAREDGPACNGVIPRTECGYPGAGSPPFDLAECGLLPDGTDAGKTASEFCLEQNPKFSAPVNSTRAQPYDPVDAGPGVYICVCGSGVPGGRNPHGLELGARSVETLGDFFAAAAESEAASVDGFEILEAELAAHGAPARLLRASRRAAMDERRHAAAMTELAVARGAVPRATPVKRGAVRSLEEIAMENAVVGCVIETYSAAVAEWQAEHAEDDGIAGVMGAIARDEARHSALAWRAHEWLLEQLSPGARDRVHSAMNAAFDDVEANVLAHAFPDRAAAGLPTAREGRALARSLRALLGVEAVQAA